MTEACVHHWVLSSGESATVPGKCRKCGETKAFSGYVSYGEQSLHRINRANATEAKRMKYGIHLPGSPAPKANEIVW